MTDVNINENETAQDRVALARGNEASPPPKPAPSMPPKIVKEAEHKLKEMSRKAKERKTAHNASKQKALSEVNYFWLVIGGLGALAVGYLVFGGKEPEVKPRPRYRFVPKPKTPEGSALTPKAKKVKEPPVEKEEEPVPKFELNCF